MAHWIEQGTSFERWTVISYEGGRSARCRCVCGREKTVDIYTLRRGLSRSCGCILREITARRNRTHGRARTREHRAWCDAKRRCHDSRRRDFERYGARGITMCEEWRNDFAAFFRDMGPCPEGFTIDRIDNERGYEPGNCRWADRITQSNNRRTCVRKVTFRGKTQSAAAWGRELGLGHGVMGARLIRGWSIERAITTPPLEPGSRRPLR